MTRLVPRNRVFIHSNWRSGGTYFWSKFRLHQAVYGYYEPLFEGLARISARTILTDRAWHVLGHTLTAPSKLEYLPHLDANGVAGFPADYCYGGYFLSPRDEAPELQSYFARLIGFAEARAKMPVFGMVRSGLRIGWFKARLGGCHIAIRRSHRHRWISYLRQAAQVGPYFLERGLIIVGRNRDHPALAGLLDLLDLPDLGRTREHENAYRDAMATFSVPRHYVIFAYLDRLQQIEAERHADLLIDLDQVTGDSEAARDAEARLSALTGLDLALSDCVLPRYDDVLPRWSGFYDEIDAHIFAAADAVARRSEEAAALRTVDLAPRLT